MTHTLLNHLSDEELINFIYVKQDVTDCELELAHRLEVAIESANSGAIQSGATRTTSPELEEVLRSVEHVTQIQLEFE